MRGARMWDENLVARAVAIAALLGVAASAADSLRAQSPPGTLDDRCIVSVLNRNVRVKPDGSWVLPNIPANFGPVRARATCIFDGVTVSGESAPFEILSNRSVNVPPIVLGPTTPIPTSVQVTAATSTLTSIGATSQLTVTARYADGSTRDVTAAATGTRYVVSNPAFASLTSDGLAQALSSGTVLFQATHEGTSGFASLQVVLAGDTDRDGIPDDVELALGLNPANAADALEDADRDGSSNVDEYRRGTNMRVADTDADGLLDGAEAARGTNPLVADTDGDGVGDGLEVQTGSNPLDNRSVNLADALDRMDVTPSTFALAVNSVELEASVQLTVTGHLRDGSTIDLTSTTRGTNYASSDLGICNFGAPDGRVFAGADGACTITVSNSGFEQQVPGSVTSFSQAPLTFVDIPGFANNVDVGGNYAYVAAGAAGLQIVQMSGDRRTASIIAAFDTPGNANDVKVVGNFAFVADGSGGLQIVNVTDPATPAFAGAIDTPGTAWNVAVVNNRAYVADGTQGLRIIDVTDPATPRSLGSVVPTPGTYKGVAVDASRNLAVLAAGGAGLRVIDVSNAAAPRQVGFVTQGLSDARAVALKGMAAFVADYNNSFTVVNLTDEANPQVVTSLNQSLGGRLNDVTVQGSFALGADVFFVNGVPIISVSDPLAPNPRAILDFRQYRDDDGQGIAADASYVYLAAVQGSAFVENGSTGTSRLYIGQYLARFDRNGVAPTVTIASPSAGAQFIEGSGIPFRVTASDDVAVAAVNFLVNGTVVFTDTSEPFEFTLTAPAPATVTLGATAADLGNNVGTAEPIAITTTPDPLTTVQGRVVNGSGTAMVGAVASTRNRSAVTDSTGGFTITGVPTAGGDLVVSAVYTDANGTQRGSSAFVPPVPSGVTDVGTIVVRSAYAYYGYAPHNSTQVKITGWTNGTTYSVRDLGNPTVNLTGTVNRLVTTTVALPVNVRYFKVETNAPALVTHGYDCCAFGGSFFYPAIDGELLVGRDFVIRIPVLNGNNTFVIFAHEASEVTIANAAGAPVSTQSLTAGSSVIYTGSPLAAGVPYRITSTGDISMQSNSKNAFTSVPSRQGTDVGTSFLFAVNPWNATAAAVFAYEPAEVTIRNVVTNAVVSTFTMTAGTFRYTSLGNVDGRYRVDSTGRIAVWGGSNEGANSIEWMGDDLNVNVGDNGTEFYVHTQTQGGVVFASENQTRVTVGTSVSVLNEGQYIPLAANQFLRITSDKPVVVETVGGNGLNDWETLLRLAPLLRR